MEDFTEDVERKIPEKELVNWNNERKHKKTVMRINKKHVKTHIAKGHAPNKMEQNDLLNRMSKIEEKVEQLTELLNKKQNIAIIM